MLTVFHNSPLPCIFSLISREICVPSCGTNTDFNNSFYFAFPPNSNLNFATLQDITRSNLWWSALKFFNLFTVFISFWTCWRLACTNAFALFDGEWATISSIQARPVSGEMLLYSLSTSVNSSDRSIGSFGSDATQVSAKWVSVLSVWVPEWEKLGFSDRICMLASFFSRPVSLVYKPISFRLAV